MGCARGRKCRRAPEIDAFDAAGPSAYGKFSERIHDYTDRDLPRRMNVGANSRIATDFGANEQARSAIVQSDGMIIIGGSFGMAGYHADGTLDTNFGNGGRLTTLTNIGNLVQDSQGRLVAN